MYNANLLMSYSDGHGYEFNIWFYSLPSTQCGD